jgi:POT family proton-dependent oligopeptide transporter
LGIGGGLEGKLGPYLYDVFASKERFARELLADKYMDAAAVEAIPQGEGFDHLVQISGETAEAMTTLLYNSHNPSIVWNIMGVIGLISAAGIVWYGRWIKTLTVTNDLPKATALSQPDDE